MITIDHHLSWEVRLLFFYLLFACVFLLVRVVQVAWFLWRSRHTAVIAKSPELHQRLLYELRLASLRNTSLRRGTTLTLLLSLFTLAATATNTLHLAVTEKLFMPAFWAGSMFDGFAGLSAGLAVSVVFYAAFSLLKGKLSRRKLDYEKKPNNGA